MKLTRLFHGAVDLGAPPADRDFPARMPVGELAYVVGYNLSPFCFEIQYEDSSILGIALPFAPFQFPLGVRTEKLIVHASSGAMVPAAPLANADLAFYIGVTDFEPDLIPGPF